MEFSFSNIVDNILTEGVETKNMKLAKHYLYDNFGYDEDKAMQVIGSIKHDIGNVRLAKCKFLLGVTRMFMNREITDGDTIMNLNSTLRLVASEAHVNEYNNDLNGLLCQELIKRFERGLQQDLEDRQNALGSEEFTVNNDYEIVKIPNFETANQYADYTSWCVTQDPSMYSNYTYGCTGLFYFCLKHGFEDIPMEKGENCPLDEYGLSMIAVSVKKDGSCNTITCRWNHDNGGSDQVMDDKQLSNLIGRNFYEVFKPYTEEELVQKEREKDEYFINYMNNIIEDGTFMDMVNEGYNWAIEVCKSDRANDEDEDGNPLFYDENGEVMYNEDGDLATERTYFYIVSTMIDCGTMDYYTDEVTVCDLYGDEEKYLIVTSDLELLDNIVYDAVHWNYTSETLCVTKGGHSKILNIRGQNMLPMDFKGVETMNNNAIVENEGGEFAMMTKINNYRYDFVNGKWFDSINFLYENYFVCANIIDDIPYFNIYDDKGNIIIKNFENYKTISEILFIYINDNSFMLYNYNRDVKVLRKASNIDFKQGLGFVGVGFDNYGYKCEGIDGNYYYIDCSNFKTYRLRSQNSKQDGMILVDDANSIQENFKRFYNRISKNYNINEEG